MKYNDVASKGKEKANAAEEDKKSKLEELKEEQREKSQFTGIKS